MENVRIDKGVKRPKHAHRPPMRRNPETGFVEGIPAGLDPDKIIEMYLSQPTTSAIAIKLGVRRSTLVWWIREQRPEKWKQVQIIRSMCRKEDAEDGLDVACDALALARAREQLRGAQWDLERLDSATYGQKQELKIGLSEGFEGKLAEARRRVIDITPAAQQVTEIAQSTHGDDSSA